MNDWKKFVIMINFKPSKVKNITVDGRLLSSEGVRTYSREYSVDDIETNEFFYPLKNVTKLSRQLEFLRNIKRLILDHGFITATNQLIVINDVDEVESIAVTNADKFFVT